MPSVVTANSLRSGAVVYLGPEGRWVEQLADADVAHDAAGAIRLETRALVAVTANVVTAVYAMDVRLVDGQPAPLSVRETIRAARSPSV